MKRSISRVPVLAAILSAVLTGGGLQAQKLDLNTNGVSDVWEQLFDAALLDARGDADGDGMSNLFESLAGTNPFDSNSAPRIASLALASNQLSVSMPSTLGKKYQLQSTTPQGNGGWSNWVNGTSTVARTGAVVTLAGTVSVASKFFRVAISDVDTDGDGLNDWEEYLLGLDPTQPSSNGQMDSMGQPLSDYAYAAGRMAVQNMVTIVATGAACSQPDPGQSARDAGLLTVNRGGFPLRSLTVNLEVDGPGPGLAVEGLDYAPIPRALILPPSVSAGTITLEPLPNPGRLGPGVARIRLVPGLKYFLGNSSNASFVINPTPTPGGTGLTGRYFTNSSPTHSDSANFRPQDLRLKRLDSNLDFVWGPSSAVPITNSGYFSVQWFGQVQPEFSETYYFVVNADDGAMLWVNGVMIANHWTTGGTGDLVGSIDLLAGVRYDLRLDYFNSGGPGQVHLLWYSASQPKQIIPTGRLYPATVSAAPSTVTSPLMALAFLGRPFSYAVTGANSPLGFTAGPLPPGLSFTNGLISGTPTLAGDFQLTLTASNAIGMSASVLGLHVVDTDRAVTREVWANIAGTNVSDIPVDTTPTTTTSLGVLQGFVNYGDNYGERIRGYVTAPATGNYYFWIAASDAAELWISSDSEAANKVRRAYVLPAGKGTGSQQWSAQPYQRSPWLALEAGQRYYVEILHKAGAGTNDNWAVGWLQDPAGTNTSPAELVPAYVLSRYFPPSPSLVSGALCAATLLPQDAAASSGAGWATLRLSADGSRAVLVYRANGLSSPMTARHIHSDATLNHPSQILFDIDSTPPQPDGSYVWYVAPVGTFTNAADIVAAIRAGQTFINLHTINHPAGELSGHFTLVDGAQAFKPPPAPPAWTDDHTDAKAAARFLLQTTFGPSLAEIARVQALGYAGWISNQLALPVSHHLPAVLAGLNPDPVYPYPSTLAVKSWWQQSVSAPDQLRQRVAFALSELMVVSGYGLLADYGQALSAYYDLLLDNAFGNYRALLKGVTLAPAMGLYLDMRGNDKGDLTRGTRPNENFAREILQLFSVGLYRRWPDGTLVMDSTGNLVPTYDQPVIMGLANVFTGWTFYQTNQANGRLPVNFLPAANYTNPMVLVPTHHELGSKRILDNVVLPPAWGSQTDPASTNFDNYGLRDLDAALDYIVANESLGPFICRQLIQRLVTSNPSRDYVYRVAQKFNDNGAGVRGDLQAVVKAILMDYEARSPAMLSQPAFGKQREPLLRVSAVARAFPAPTPLGGVYTQNGSEQITVTTTNLHRLAVGDALSLAFQDSSGHAVPPAQTYTVAALSSPTAFAVNAPGISSGTYKQLANQITITSPFHGLNPGDRIYMVFTTGGASNGVYQVVTVPDLSSFTITGSDFVGRLGNCSFPLLVGGGFVQSGTNLTVNTALAHELNTNDMLYLKFAVGTGTNGTYRIAAVPDSRHFIVNTGSPSNHLADGLVVCPLVAPSLFRSGTIALPWNSWDMGLTDRGDPSSLSQTPLHSPTVFNFFSPDYKFPGPLASANLTTPEFELTSDTEVMLQMNFLLAGVEGNPANTNGLSSYREGSGAMIVDLGPWMTPAFTSNTGVPALVDALNTLLLGGQLSSGAKAPIVNYVANTTNFPYATPTATEMRDRVRAVVELLIASPDFTIQR